MTDFTIYDFLCGLQNGGMGLSVYSGVFCFFSCMHS